MQATIIAGDHLGKTVEIETIEENASKVRICKGFDWAGQVLWINNSEIDWDWVKQHESDWEPQKEEIPNKWIPTAPIDWVKYIVAGVAILALSIKLIVWIPQAVQESKIRQATNELNELNLLDATDVELRNQAQERINGRTERKKELIKTINFQWTP